MNKKSQISGRKILFYAIVSFMSAIIIFFMIFFINYKRSEIADIPIGVEDYLISYRFLNSPMCFAFEDKESKRSYPQVIDIEKFTEQNLNNCYSAKGTNVKAFRLTLSYGTDKKTIATSNWQGFIKSGKTIQAFVYDKNQLQKAELFIEIQDVK